VEELREPLHGEVRGRDDEGALDEPRVEQRREDEARLDRLAEADLVGEHEAGLGRREHVVRDRDLVRLHVDAAGEERSQGVGAALEIEPDGFRSEREVLRTSPPAAGELLDGTCARRGRAQIRFATDGGLLARRLDRVALQLALVPRERA